MRKKIIGIYITVPNLTSAHSLSKSLLDHKLVACANIFPISSMYFWNDKLTTDDELVIIAKTIPDLVENTEIHVKQNHPYEIPLVGSWEMEVNEEYFNWMRSQFSK